MGCSIKISRDFLVERQTGNSHVNMAASLLESALPQALRGCLLPWKEVSFRRQTPYGDRELREDKHTGRGGRVWVQQMKRVKTTEERRQSTSGANDG